MVEVNGCFVSSNGACELLFCVVECIELVEGSVFEYGISRGL